MINRDEWLAFLRHQWHDTMNVMQVAMGYLQIGRTQESLLYLQMFSEKMRSSREIFKAGVPALIESLLFWEQKLSLQQIVLNVAIDKHWDPLLFSSAGEEAFVRNLDRLIDDVLSQTAVPQESGHEIDLQPKSLLVRLEIVEGEPLVQVDWLVERE